MKTIAIIQARMGSTRLPGKVMKNLAGKTIIQHVIERVTAASLLDETIIATTASPQDDIIVGEAERLKIKVFRGSEQDVLSRYYQAAVAFKADIIVRVTADCPLFDSHILDKMLRIFLEENAAEPKLDYMSNSLQLTFPRGLDAEIFTFKSLEKAFTEADKEYEREHVTPFIYLNPDVFRIKNFSNARNLSRHRWTLDTREDFTLLEKIYEYSDITSEETLTTKEVLSILERHPELLSLNAHVRQKRLGE